MPDAAFTLHQSLKKSNFFMTGGARVVCFVGKGGKFLPHLVESPVKVNFPIHFVHALRPTSTAGPTKDDLVVRVLVKAGD